MLSAQDVINLLQLEPLPTEGGMFRQTYRSRDELPPEHLPARFNSLKPAGTAIYYFLTAARDSFSAIHRLPTDEVFHFYLGDPVELLQLHPDGRSKHIILGPDIARGQRVQHVVPRGTWQGSYLLPGGYWALLGTTMAPGFTAEDYYGGDREELLADYPQEAELIRRLTRPGSHFRAMP